MKYNNVTASSCLAEVELSYKSKVKPSDRIRIKSYNDTETLLRSLYNENRIEHVEEFYILMLNRANRFIGWNRVSAGGVAGTMVDPKIVFQLALLANASGIILSHNHPSGNTIPSAEDVKLTNKLVSCGKLLDIAVLDHIIITSDSYYSFNENDLI